VIIITIPDVTKVGPANGSSHRALGDTADIANTVDAIANNPAAT
jgi:hypothetical protein